MTSIKDDKGYNQGFKSSLALKIRTQRRCDAILRKFRSLENVRVLEVGCGTGEMAGMIAKKIQGQLFAIDVCEPFIEKARNDFPDSNITFQAKDFNKTEDLKWLKERGPFDYIIGNGILHHLYENLDSSLANIRSLLKGNGKIVFWEPNIWNPYCLLIFKIPTLRKLAKLEPQEMAFGREFIEKKLKNVGFNNVKVACKDFLLPNAPSYLINILISVGNVLEKTPLLNMLSQSLFISAEKG